LHGENNSKNDDKDKSVFAAAIDKKARRDRVESVRFIMILVSAGGDDGAIRNRHCKEKQGSPTVMTL
jgi:hypothetical protein